MAVTLDAVLSFRWIFRSSRARRTQALLIPTASASSASRESFARYTALDLANSSFGPPPIASSLAALVISTAAVRFSSLAACTGCSPICVARNLWPVAIRRHGFCLTTNSHKPYHFRDSDRFGIPGNRCSRTSPLVTLASPEGNAWRVVANDVLTHTKSISRYSFRALTIPTAPKACKRLVQHQRRKAAKMLTLAMGILVGTKAP